ncbi:hypothetical protein CYLTODRAFT_421382 [Cylindrobasidium torrendii FP15055 ss-10]|uniref:Uncharacterized protein n=1 Tax=Cylindrobasidium torrendii FP15055 ss-10 TaxID=1314674 RepID=A0A0D7BE40_9AGAR|nr:hypothetical protein CYLTODRAFT_421382 [Cylindrobasidium torrendii FP15055 ss-10]
MAAVLPAPQAPSNKRKLSFFTTSARRSSRLSSLLSLSSSRTSAKSAPTCTISLECATPVCPSITPLPDLEPPCRDRPLSPVPFPSEDEDNIRPRSIPFPSSLPDCESDSDSEMSALDATSKVRRRSLQATPRSSLSEEEQRSCSSDSQCERLDTGERTRKSSFAKRKSPARRPVVHHNLLAPASHKTPAPRPRKRHPHLRQSDLRFLAAVWRSVSVGLDERMTDAESDLQEQDRLFADRLEGLLTEYGLRDAPDALADVLTPSQIVAVATLRRRDSTGSRNSKSVSRRRSPLASP